MGRSSLGGPGAGREEEATPNSPRRNSSLRQLAARAHLHHHGHGHGHHPHGNGLSKSLTPPPGSPFLLDDDPYPMHMHGQGTLVNLLRNRSTTSLHQPSVQRGWRVGFSLGGDDLEAGPGAVDASFIDRPSSGLRLAEMDPEERRLSAILLGQNVRSMRLIGNSNPRYKWARYWKTEEELRQMKKPIRQYYERTNYLVQQYLYIDRLLDSSLPHDLLNEYNDMPRSNFRGNIEIPATIMEAEERNIQNQKLLPGASEMGNGNRVDGQMNYGSVGTQVTVLGPSAPNSPRLEAGPNNNSGTSLNTVGAKKVKRTPKDIYRPSETTPLFNNDDDDDDDDEEIDFLGPPGDDSDTLIDPETGERRRKKKPKPEVPWLDEEDEDLDSGHRIVTLAIYVNFLANAILLAGKIAVIISVPSMSVLASLVDAVLDFLSTAIVWTTTWMISHNDQYRYPVGRRRLEPLGVLVFSIIMITSFVQVALECTQSLLSDDHTIIQLGIPAIAIMVGTIVIKGAVWLWCRLVKNSSVQALAEDAMTDIIFNTGSILFPIAGFYWQVWWLDALGGLLLSLIVIFNWSQTSAQHIKNLTGFSATADQRNVLLYLTMRFAKTIKQIQGLQAYHVGDKLNVEVDIVLDASTLLRDSHDLAESLGYVLESIPVVDRAFVHVDYASWNLPTHMSQQGH